MTLNFLASIKSKKIASVICIRNKVSLKRRKEEGSNSQNSFANCSISSVYSISKRSVLFFLFLSFYTNAIMYSRGLGVKYQAHANAITSYLHSH